MHRVNQKKPNWKQTKRKKEKKKEKRRYKYIRTIPNIYTHNIKKLTNGKHRILRPKHLVTIHHGLGWGHGIYVVWISRLHPIEKILLWLSPCGEIYCGLRCGLQNDVKCVSKCKGGKVSLQTTWDCEFVIFCVKCVDNSSTILGIATSQKWKKREVNLVQIPVNIVNDK